jgi:hypothetical protein
MAFDMLFVGFPMLLEGRKYHRNALLWNLAFVFEPSAEIEPYLAILRKLGFLLKNLEVESEFLSTPETKQSLRGLLQELFDGLGSRGEVSVRIGDH